MTDETMMTDEQMAKALYPRSPNSAREPAAFETEDAQVGRLFYPRGPAPPLQRRVLPADRERSAEPSTEAAKLYEPDQKPAREVHRERHQTAEHAERDAGELSEAEVEDAVSEFEAAEGRLDPDLVDEYRTAVRELRIDDAAAESLLERVGPRILARQQEQVAELERQWSEQSRAEFDDDALKLARDAVREHGGDDLVALLNQSGLGSHPALVRLVVRLARAAEVPWRRRSAGW